MGITSHNAALWPPYALHLILSSYHLTQDPTRLDLDFHVIHLGTEALSSRSVVMIPSRGGVIEHDRRGRLGRRGGISNNGVSGRTHGLN